MDTIVYDAVQDVKAVAEYNGGGIETLLNGRVVKSVQRGHLRKTGLKTNNTFDIPISSVNPDHALLLQDTFIRYNADPAWAVSIYGEGTLSSDKITIKINADSSYGAIDAGVVWQVVEFY